MRYDAGIYVLNKSAFTRDFERNKLIHGTREFAEFLDDKRVQKVSVDLYSHDEVHFVRFAQRS